MLSPKSEPITVMLVDDSAVVRGLMARALKAEEDIEVVATANDGQMALDVIKGQKIDIIILDIEMPVMDGLTALPALLKLSPYSHVIMVSTLTQRNAGISMKALDMGASDYIPKPTSASQDSSSLEGFYRELADKVRALGASARTKRLGSKIKPNQVSDGAAKPAFSKPVRTTLPKAPISAIAIASSTGGPQALQDLFAQLKPHISNLPVFITQHMPATFTKLLADHISKDTGCNCREAVDDELVQAGTVYLAPGDYHMQPESVAGNVKIKLNQNPPVNFCRPAADPMITNLVEIYGSGLLILVLTGMGSDGLEGARIAMNKGATIVAQDEESSVVWGMPGAVVKENLVNAVLPLNEIAAYVGNAVKGSRYAAS